MAEKLILPRMSDTMEEGVFANVIIKVGDILKAGSIIAEVETDKATMDLESFQEGEVLYVAIKSGDTVPVNGLIGVIGKKGEDYSALLNQANIASTPKESTKEIIVASQDKITNIDTSTKDSNKLKASPLAKKMAKELNVDLKAIVGSGDEGRITKKDIISLSQTSNVVSLDNNKPEESYTEIPVSQMRKVIAKRLAESKFGAPHFYLTIEVCMDKAKESRESINLISPSKISYNDIIIKAVALNLKKHPNINSSWLGDKIRINNHVNIGMAVAVPEGLVVPVITNANLLSLSQISEKSKSFAQRAKNKQITPDEMKGNTFSISNLGMMDIEEFTAIINPPDACILAVGSISEKVKCKNGNFYVSNVMKLTLSCDHRVVDGAQGANFLKDLKELIEDPIKMLV